MKQERFCYIFSAISVTKWMRFSSFVNVNRIKSVNQINKFAIKCALFGVANDIWYGFHPVPNCWPFYLKTTIHWHPKWNNISLKFQNISIICLLTFEYMITHSCPSFTEIYLCNLNPFAIHEMENRLCTVVCFVKSRI